MVNVSVKLNISPAVVNDVLATLPAIPAMASIALINDHLIFCSGFTQGFLGFVQGMFNAAARIAIRNRDKSHNDTSGSRQRTNSHYDSGAAIE